MKELYACILRGEPISVEEELGFQRQLVAV
jgi:hypothetical protein